MRIVTVARKPLSESTVASNVLRHGAGGLGVDASRIGTGEDKGIWPVTARVGRNSFNSGVDGSLNKPVETDLTVGRWPANLILQHRPECQCVGTRRVKGAGWRESDTGDGTGGVALHGSADGSLNASTSRHYADEDGMEIVAAWNCEHGCPVRALDEQSGDRPSTGPHPSTASTESIFRPGQGAYQNQGPLYNDTGGASRFFKQVGAVK